MGVRGLSSFAQNHEAVISEIKEYTTSSSQDCDRREKVAIDAWAWVYEVWLHLFGESIQGGNYTDVAEHAADFIHAWRSVGLEPVFFWDGPVPLIKQATFLARRAALAATNSAFMRSSSTSRASRTFQQECYPAPPLLGETIRCAMHAQGVQNVCLPGEADSAVAEFAESNQGLAVSKDSDFFILCSRGAGKSRYVPLDTVEYLIQSRPQDADQKEPCPQNGDAGTPSAQDDTDGFEAVTTRKSRTKAKNTAAAAAARLAAAASRPERSSPWPPSRHDTDQKLKSVRLRAYSSHALAAQLRLPPALLPLLGSVIGNDYSTATQDSVLFRHLTKSTDKIRETCEVVHAQWQRAANLARDPKRSMTRSLEVRLASRTLMKAAMEDNDDARSEYSDGSSVTATPTILGGGSTSVMDAATIGPPVDRVRSLIEATVNALLERADIATHRTYHVSDGEKEACIESIIESVAAYSLLTTVDSTHLIGKSRSAFLSPTYDLDNASSTHPSWDKDTRQVLSLYREAFNTASFPAQLVAAMTERICTMTIAPEDPDQKSVHLSASREIRRWIYAILFQVWGMDWARETMEEPVREQPAGDQVEQESIPSGHANGNRKTYKEGESPDDVISVDTESTYSAVDSNAQQQEEGEGEEAVEGQLERLTVFTPPEEVKPPPAVKEYVRKGDRLVGELVEIPSLVSLLRENQEEDMPPTVSELLGQYTASNGNPIEGAPESDSRPSIAPLLPLKSRLDLYAFALCCNLHTDAMKRVPMELVPLVLCLRYIIIHTAKVTGESKKRLNWTLNEVISAVQSGVHTHFSSQQGHSPLLKQKWIREPSTRGIHLSTVLQLLLESSHWLSSTLLLSSTLPSMHTLFDGPLFQFLLSHDGNISDPSILSVETRQMSEVVLEAVLENGVKHHLAIDLMELKRLRKENKKKAKKESTTTDGKEGGKKSNKGGDKEGKKNPFAMLLDQVD
ncbi:unnamed protein product [Sympodiomycopsis kandeliae]